LANVAGTSYFTSFNVVHAGALNGRYHFAITAMVGNSVSATVTLPDGSTVNLGPILFNPANPADLVTFTVNPTFTFTTNVSTVLSWNASTTFDILLNTLDLTGVRIRIGVNTTSNTVLTVIPDGTWVIQLVLGGGYVRGDNDVIAVWLVDGNHSSADYLPNDRLCDPAVALVSSLI
jgi:hypothetical protein